MAEPSPKNRAPSLHTRIGEYTLVCASLALILVSGCKPVGPNYSRPGYSAPPAYKESGATTVVLPPPNPQGGAWQPANPSDGMLKGKWWEIYEDPQLNKLEERIDSSNVRLRQAMELYLAAEAQVRAARANLYPTLSAGPSISRDRVSANRPLAVPGGATTYGDFIIAGQASWEPDFWGRIRRTVEQARENAQASAADEANVALTLHAEMATDYFALRGLDSQTQLLTDTVTTLEHQLDLTKRLFAGGVDTEVDVVQAQTQLETVRAQLVDLGVARAQYEHAIGTLANDNLPSFSIRPSPLDLALPKVPLGVPSQLLERRPDIARFIRRLPSAERGALKARTPADGFRAPARSGVWARRPRSCSSTRASATRLPMWPATITRLRPTPIAIPSSRHSTMWKTNSPRSAFWSRKRPRSSEPSIPRGTPSTSPTRATKAASPAISRCSPPSRPCCRTR